MKDENLRNELDMGIHPRRLRLDLLLQMGDSPPRQGGSCTLASTGQLGALLALADRLHHTPPQPFPRLFSSLVAASELRLDETKKDVMAVTISSTLKNLTFYLFSFKPVSVRTMTKSQLKLAVAIC